ncbi:MAG: S41 family peptidase [Bacteroidota bacterium]
MNRLFTLLLILLCNLSACQKEMLNEVKKQAVFKEMWQYIDENYIYFDHKAVDWQAVYEAYAPLVKEDISEAEFRELCFAMLNTLKDGHNRLTTPDFDENYNYRDGFNIHFDLDLIKEKYLDNNFQDIGFYTYGLLPNKIAYVHFQSFYQVGLIQEVIDFFSEQAIQGIIFDIRDNSGGTGQDAVEIVGHFIDQVTTVGYLVEKTGKAPDDVSEPLSIKAIPKTPVLKVPVVLLTNRKSYSATTYLTAQFETLPNVTIVGQITGGGGGGNQTQELSNGWLLTISSSKLLDINFDESLESGIVPDIQINNDPTALENGTDQMLEKAIQLLN